MQVPKALILEEISVFIANIFTEVLQLKAHTKIDPDKQQITVLNSGTDSECDLKLLL